MTAYYLWARTVINQDLSPIKICLLCSGESKEIFWKVTNIFMLTMSVKSQMIARWVATLIKGCLFSTEIDAIFLHGCGRSDSGQGNYFLIGREKWVNFTLSEGKVKKHLWKKSGKSEIIEITKIFIAISVSGIKNGILFNDIEQYTDVALSRNQSFSQKDK